MRVRVIVQNSKPRSFWPLPSVTRVPRSLEDWCDAVRPKSNARGHYWLWMESDRVVLFRVFPLSLSLVAARDRLLHSLSPVATGFLFDSREDTTNI